MDDGARLFPPDGYDALDMAGPANVPSQRPQVRSRSARRTDPTTSHEAAVRASDGLTQKQAAVLNCISRWGPMHDEALVQKYEAERRERMPDAVCDG